MWRCRPLGGGGAVKRSKKKSLWAEAETPKRHFKNLWENASPSTIEKVKKKTKKKHPKLCWSTLLENCTEEKIWWEEKRVCYSSDKNRKANEEHCKSWSLGMSSAFRREFHAFEEREIFQRCFDSNCLAAVVNLLGEVVLPGACLGKVDGSVTGLIRVDRSDHVVCPEHILINDVPRAVVARKLEEQRSVDRKTRLIDGLHLIQDVLTHRRSQLDDVDDEVVACVAKQPWLRRAGTMLAEKRASGTELEPSDDEFVEDGIFGVAPWIAANIRCPPCDAGQLNVEACLDRYLNKGTEGRDILNSYICADQYVTGWGGGV